MSCFLACYQDVTPHSHFGSSGRSSGAHPTAASCIPSLSSHASRCALGRDADGKISKEEFREKVSTVLVTKLKFQARKAPLPDKAAHPSLSYRREKLPSQIRQPTPPFFLQAHRTATICHLPLATSHLLLTTYHLQLTTYCLLPTACCLLPSTYYLQPTTYDLLRTSRSWTRSSTQWIEIRRACWSSLR